MFPPGVQRRVQFAVLLQFAEFGVANRITTAMMVPGTDVRDMASALEYLVDDGSLAGPTWKLRTLMSLTEGGQMWLTERGQIRVDEDDV